MITDNYTDITMLLDRSGSMASIAPETIDGFESFIYKQTQVETPCRISLIQFDNLYERVYTEVPISRIKRLKLMPRGSTALLDAMGRAITETEKRLHRKRLRNRPSQVLFVTITDGLENSSHRFSHGQIQELIARQRESFDWQFIYLGANQDAIREAARYGIESEFAMTYHASPDCAAQAWNGLGSAVMRKRKAHVRGDSAIGEFFTQAERKKSVE